MLSPALSPNHSPMHIHYTAANVHPKGLTGSTGRAVDWCLGGKASVGEVGRILLLLRSRATIRLRQTRGKNWKFAGLI